MFVEVTGGKREGGPFAPLPPILNMVKGSFIRKLKAWCVYLCIKIIRQKIHNSIFLERCFIYMRYSFIRYLSGEPSENYPY